MNKDQLLLNVVSDMRSLADSLQTLADSVAKEVTASEETPSTPATPHVTLEQVRALLADKSRSGKTADVRELLKKFSAAKLSEVDPARYEELLAAAEVL